MQRQVLWSDPSRPQPGNNRLAGLRCARVKLACDRNAKAILTSVDARQILEKLACMPIQNWSYKTDPASVRHVGLTFQDFQLAFGFTNTHNRLNIMNVSDDFQIKSIVCFSTRNPDSTNLNLSRSWRGGLRHWRVCLFSFRPCLDARLSRRVGEVPLPYSANVTGRGIRIRHCANHPAVRNSGRRLQGLGPRPSAYARTRSPSRRG